MASSLAPGQWNDSLAHAVEKEGGWQQVGITSADLKSILTPNDFMSLFPIGAVMMWDDHTTIPVNWEVIPESVQRFPRGIAAPDPALTQAGSDIHPHNDHANHVVTQPADHFWSATSTGNNNGTTTVTDDGTNQVTVPSNPHDHVFQPASQSHTGGAVDAHSAHSTGTNIPAYFTIFFIRKVA